MKNIFGQEIVKSRLERFSLKKIFHYLDFNILPVFGVFLKEKRMVVI